MYCFRLIASSACIQIHYIPLIPCRQTIWTLIRLLLREQSDLGPYCLQHRLSKYRKKTIKVHICKQAREQTTSVMNGGRVKVSKGAKIRNWYNQVTHLTQDTNGKVTNSQLDIINECQEVSPFPAGDHKAHINRRVQRHSKHKTDKT